MITLSTFEIAAFSAGVTWFAYVYAGYPLLLGFLALTRPVRCVRRDDFEPFVSVLISARNEEADIGWKISETLAWNYPRDRLQVLVGSDASEDGTDTIVRSISDPRVRLVRMDRRSGKGRVLNRLVRDAVGDMLFFTDANSHVGPDCLHQMVRHFADPKVGCVTGHSYAGLKEGSPVAETGTAVYWGHELLIKYLDDKFGAVLACDGAIFSIRRSLYTEVSPELANDLELPLKIYHAGYRVCFEPNARVMERDTISPSQEFARRRRICAQGALAMVRLRQTLRGLRAVQFLSHKVLRWLTIIPLTLLLLSSAAMMNQPFFATVFALQVAFYAAALAGSIQAARSASVSRLLSVPVYVVVNSIGAFTGVCDAIIGRRFDIWQSPTLTRGPDESNGSRVDVREPI